MGGMEFSFGMGSNKKEQRQKIGGVKTALLFLATGAFALVAQEGASQTITTIDGDAAKELIAKNPGLKRIAVPKEKTAEQVAKEWGKATEASLDYEKDENGVALPGYGGTVTGDDVGTREHGGENFKVKGYDVKQDTTDLFYRLMKSSKTSKMMKDLGLKVPTDFTGLPLEKQQELVAIYSEGMLTPAQFAAMLELPSNKGAETWVIKDMTYTVVRADTTKGVEVTPPSETKPSPADWKNFYARIYKGIKDGTITPGQKVKGPDGGMYIAMVTPGKPSANPTNVPPHAKPFPSGGPTPGMATTSLGSKAPTPQSVKKTGYMAKDYYNNIKKGGGNPSKPASSRR